MPALSKRTTKKLLKMLEEIMDEQYARERARVDRIRQLSSAPTRASSPSGKRAKPKPPPNDKKTAKLRKLRLAGRLANGAEFGTGRLFHAVPEDRNVALCGVQPGRLSAGWLENLEGDATTCPKCIQHIALRANIVAAKILNGR